MNREDVLNFSAGPGALPVEVLNRAREGIINYKGSGRGIIEFSHRSLEVIDLIADTCEKLKELLNLGDLYEVILLQGGGTQQFSMVALNFSNVGDPVLYVDTGYWTSKALNEAKRLQRNVIIPASSAERRYRYIPELDRNGLPGDAAYLHICSNNTVVGTQWSDLPRVDLPLIVDMSSDILSRDIDVSHVDLMYAHAQKTVGTAGVTMAIIKKSFLEKRVDTSHIPAVLDYSVHIKGKSNYHTPPVFAIYMVNLMLEWLEKDIGGVRQMEALNSKKASMLYELIDSSRIFHCDIEPGSRSQMNVVFHMESEQALDAFVQTAEAHGVFGLRGHRSQGGCRASLYNPVSVRDVERLVEFMSRYETEEARAK